MSRLYVLNLLIHFSCLFPCRFLKCTNKKIIIESLSSWNQYIVNMSDINLSLWPQLQSSHQPKLHLNFNKYAMQGCITLFHIQHKYSIYEIITSIEYHWYKIQKIKDPYANNIYTIRQQLLLLFAVCYIMYNDIEIMVNDKVFRVFLWRIWNVHHLTSNHTFLNFFGYKIQAKTILRLPIKCLFDDRE